MKRFDASGVDPIMFVVCILMFLGCCSSQKERLIYKYESLFVLGEVHLSMSILCFVSYLFDSSTLPFISQLGDIAFVFPTPFFSHQTPTIPNTQVNPFSWNNVPRYLVPSYRTGCGKTRVSLSSPNKRYH
jgi:hypothetical protein